MRRSYLHRGDQASERSFSSKEARATRKRAKHYDNVDSYSMNNEFTDPDFDRYEVKTSDNFGEDPDMGTDWRRDVEKGFDDESNFMLPLEQASPYNLSPKLAARKASACIKIAQQLFPDGTDEFIDVQASDLMHLPSQVVAATLVRMSQYNEEPDKVASLKTAEEEEAPAEEAPKDEAPAEEAPKEEAPAEEAAPAPIVEQVEEIQTAVDELQKEFDEIVEENASDMSNELEEDLEAVSEDIDELTEMVDEFEVDDLDSEMADMDAEMMAEGDDDMDVDFSDEDGDDMGLSLDGEEIDAKLAAAFMGDENTQSFENLVNKAAKVKAASKNSNTNLKLSKLMGNKVAKRSNADDLLVDGLWDYEPSIEDAFSY